MFCLCLLPASGLQAGLWSSLKKKVLPEKVEVPKIKVLVADKLDGVYIEVSGAHNIYDPLTKSRLGTRFVGKGCFLQPLRTGMMWGEQFPGVYQIRITPDNEQTTILVNGTQYRGELLVYQFDDQISVVNEVSIEDYVKTVVSPRFVKSLGTEAMAAVAISARTDAYHKSAVKKDAYWHVRASEVGYLGLHLTVANNGVKEAVDSTRHLVLINELDSQSDGTFAALTTANCGGTTIAYHKMFRQEGHSPREGVRSLLAERDKANTAWQVVMPKSELASRFGLSSLTDLHLMTDRFSQKVYQVRLIDDGQSKDISYSAFQAGLGEQSIKSSDFSVVIDGDQVLFSGIGEGHGVGLCLYSAEKMDELGKKATNILQEFFPHTRLELRDTEDSRWAHAESYYEDFEQDVI